MPVARRDYEDKGDESDKHDAIPTASRRRRHLTELQRVDLGTSDVDRNKGEYDDDVGADADEEEEASQADDGSMQNVEDWGHSR